jgi:hypothetical protein
MKSAAIQTMKVHEDALVMKSKKANNLVKSRRVLAVG